MQLINGTGMAAGYTMGLRPDGRELLVVVVKGTFDIPSRPDEEPTLAAEQVPLVTADVFEGAPGTSAPLYESDYAPHKPRCDVLLLGSAYAPGGEPAEVVPVAVRVGPLEKGFNVVGDRVWRKGLLGVSATRPEPFRRMPVSYGNAFGGVDRSAPNEAKHRWYPLNFAGRGYHENTAAEHIDGKPLPNTEAFGEPVRSPRGKYAPMSFGPVGRAWGTRPKLAGTFDEDWKANVFPFLPADFDDRYYQAAPPDQQCDALAGGEQVLLRNLTPGGECAFRLPAVSVPVAFYPAGGGPEVSSSPSIDTVMIEPDRGRFSLCWRARWEVRDNIFEVRQAIAGRMPERWHSARRAGKRYYGSLGELVRDRRAGRGQEAGAGVAAAGAGTAGGR